MSQVHGSFRGTERFSIVRRIGAGGMGVVYEAFDRDRSERVALKTLREFDSVALYRFKQEFRSLSEILHPHLVPLYELIGEGDRWFFTMELVEGATDSLTFLRGADNAGDMETDTSTNAAPGRDAAPGAAPGMALRGVGPPAAPSRRNPDRPPASSADYSQVRDVFCQIAEGVHALHTAGKLHRDLKPSNVLVTAEGRVVILDFGLVASLASTTPDLSPSPADAVMPTPLYLSTDGSLAGTFAYMSPEQAARAPLGPASDWYAVGVMLFQALTGRLPFEGSAADVLAHKQTTTAPAPSGLASGVPGDLEELTIALLHREPTQRPRAGEILAALGNTAAGRSSTLQAMADPFVGRADHLRELTRAFAAMREGRTIVCHVSGRSGAGKSTLLAQFLAHVDRQDAPVVLRGRCYEQESVPYKALDSLVDALARHLMTLTADEVARLAPPDMVDLARVFPVLAQVQRLVDGGSLEGSAHDLRDLRRRAVRALRTLLVRLGRTQPLVLCIDDLQWGDLDSVAVIWDLLEPPDAPPLLLLLSYRSEYLDSSACLQALVRPPAPDTARDADQRRMDWRIDVDALAAADTRVLAETLLRSSPSGPQPAHVVDWIVRESAGRPFFVYELVAHLNTGAELGAPRDLDSVLWDRVTRLPEDARRLLEVIAVAGRPIQLRDVQTAALLARLPPDVVAVLRAGRFVRTSGRSMHDEIETFHDRIRESILARLPAADRQRYHAALASTLERGGRADVETLAAHWEGAGDQDRASRYYEQAADNAVQVLAFERAEALLQRAAALTARQGDRARIHERMIHFYTDTARFADAYATARSALGAFGVRLPASFVPPLFLVDFLSARLRLRGKSTDDLLTLPTATNETLVASIRLMNAVAKAAYQIRPELCVAVATKIVNLCLRHGNTPDCAIGYVVFGAIFHGGVLGQHRFGYEFGRLALALVERHHQERQRAEVNFVVGYFATSWLRPAVDAEALWAVAFEAGLQTGDLFHTGCACAGTTMSRFMRGVALPTVREDSGKMVDVLRRNQLREPLGVVLAVRRAVDQLRGETTDLEDGFDDAAFDRGLGAYGSRHFAHMCVIVRMQVLYLRGEVAAAIAAAARSAEYVKDSRGMLHIADHYFYQALALSAAGQSARVVSRACRRLRKWAAECPDNFLHKSQLLEGERLRRRGRTLEAAAMHRLAADTARLHNTVHIEALAAELESRALDTLGRRAEAEAARSRSAEAYRRWGATSLAARLAPSSVAR